MPASKALKRLVKEASEQGSKKILKGTTNIAAESSSMKAYRELKDSSINVINDAISNLGANVDISRGVTNKTKNASSKAADDILQAKRKAQQEAYEKLFNNENELVFNRENILRKNSKNEVVLNNNEVKRQTERMNKEYQQSYDNIRKDMLPNDMTREKFFKMQNDKEVRDRIATNKKVYSAEKNIQSKINDMNQLNAINKYGGKNKSKNIEEMKQKRSNIDKDVGSEKTKPKENINSNNKAKDYITKANMQKAVGLGVGGYLVLNMFDKGGKMSNAELYGQTQSYGY